MNNVEQFQFIFHIFAILANYQKIGVKLIYHNYDPEFNLGNGILNQSKYRSVDEFGYSRYLCVGKCDDVVGRSYLSITSVSDGVKP